MKNAKNIGIIFKKNIDGIYCYSEFVVFEKGTTQDLSEYNVITLDESKFSDIMDKKSGRIFERGNANKRKLLITLDQTVFDKLVEGLSVDNTKDPIELIRSELEPPLRELGGIEFNTIAEIIMEYKFDFENKKEYNPEESKEETTSKIDVSKINPKELIEKIEKKIIAQDRAIKDIVYNVHNNQVLIDGSNEDYLTIKATILIDGPSGSGKTAIIKLVAKELSIPMIVANASDYSAVGYKGADLSDILVRLLEKTNGDLETAQRGIVAIDEFDKLGYNSTLEMKQAVQHDLLTYMSGTVVPVEYNGKKYDFDTSKITFICMGAFEKLKERKISEGLDEDGNYKISSEDYVNEGFARELINRFSVFTSTQSLNKEDLIRILKESELSHVKQLINNAKLHNKELIISDDIIEKIAILALELNQEARGLEDIVEGIRNVIYEDMYNKEIDRIVVDDEVLEKSINVAKRRVVNK